MSVQVPLNSQFKNYNYVINKKLMPIIETHNNVDYYDDVEKNDVEEILKKIQEKDEVGYNLNIFTFIKITFVTIVGLFCIS
jgi:fructose-bisphosphate aldolase class 1